MLDVHLSVSDNRTHPIKQAYNTYKPGFYALLRTQLKKQEVQQSIVWADRTVYKRRLESEFLSRKQSNFPE